MQQLSPQPQLPIAVFDSGIGGLSVLRALRAELPHEDFVYYADSAFAPYGEQNDAYVLARAQTVAHSLLAERQAKALVVACNTATAAAIDALRLQYPQLPIVGIEPALKPAAALSRTGRIGVLATRSTLGSVRFQQLLQKIQASNTALQFVCQPCDGLAEAIESLAEGVPGTAFGAEPGAAQSSNAHAINLVALCAQYTSALGLFGSETGQIDSLVLGCTHYPLVAEQLRHALGPLAAQRVQFLEPGGPVAKRTRQLLQERQALAQPPHAGRLALLSSGSVRSLQQAMARYAAEV